MAKTAVLKTTAPLQTRLRALDLITGQQGATQEDPAVVKPNETQAIQEQESLRTESMRNGCANRKRAVLEWSVGSIRRRFLSQTTQGFL